jgi:conjugative transfer signal peptidase TraF
MKGLSKRLQIVSAALCLFLTALGAALFLSGARINTSNSIPIGLYWKIARPTALGDYVIFCPPQNDLFREARARRYLGAGFCPGGFGPLMKQVAAISGDIVSISEDGVKVNGKRRAFSRPMSMDLEGRSLPQPRITRKLKASELLLMTDQNPVSFDARYFGPINQSQVESVIKPVLTWALHQHLTGY